MTRLVCPDCFHGAIAHNKNPCEGWLAGLRCTCKGTSDFIQTSTVCWDCGVAVGQEHGQTRYGRCDGYEVRRGRFIRPVLA